METRWNDIFPWSILRVSVHKYTSIRVQLSIGSESYPLIVKAQTLHNAIDVWPTTQASPCAAMWNAVAIFVVSIGINVQSVAIFVVSIDIDVLSVAIFVAIFVVSIGIDVQSVAILLAIFVLQDMKLIFIGKSWHWLIHYLRPWVMRKWAQFP